MTNTNRTWSPQQLAIFAWFCAARQPGLGQALVVRARAGTGKTTTILEAVQRAYATGLFARICLAAFNRRIANELVEKLKAAKAPADILAKTLHGLGFVCILKSWRGTKLDSEKGQDRDWNNAKKVCTSVSAPDDIIAMVKKLAGLGKNMMPLMNSRDSRDIEDLADIGADFDCVPDSEEWRDTGWTPTRVAKLAALAMDEAAKRDPMDIISFDDMIFIPLRQRMTRATYDMMVVDEAQDMNVAQLLLAQRLTRPEGRFIIVGDDRQAIYGFRGADSGALDRMKEDLKADELGLTVTYRCPQLVVALAQKMVADYQAAPAAPEGFIEKKSRTQCMEVADMGDVFLSRKNAPLAGICLGLLRAGKRARIEGKDIGRGLVAIVRKLTKLKKQLTIEEFLERLTKWQETETNRAKARGKNVEEKTQLVADQAETISNLAEGLVEISELVARIESLFDDSDKDRRPAIVCSSVHKAKGLEWRRVFLLEDTFKSGSGNVEEDNIYYVALTRTQETLVFTLSI